MARELLPPDTELVPGKTVCVKKGGTGAHRARAVFCANMASETADPSPGPAGSYASGADGTLIRCAVRQAAHEGWLMSALDVKSAFNPAGPETYSTGSQSRGGGSAQDYVATGHMSGERSLDRSQGFVRLSNISELLGTSQGHHVRQV